MSTTDKAGEPADKVRGAVSPADEPDKARQQQQVEQEQEDQEADAQSPATAVLEAAQPFQVEGGEGKVHQMQARHAKFALQEAVLDARHHLLKAADVRPVLRKYPYVAVGGSLAAGFVAAAVLVPSKKQRAASRLRALERAVRAEAAAGKKSLGKGGGASPTKRVLGLVWRFARPTLLSMVTGAISGAAGGASADEGNGNGGGDAAQQPSADTADVT